MRQGEVCRRMAISRYRIPPQRHPELAFGSLHCPNAVEASCVTGLASRVAQVSQRAGPLGMLLSEHRVVKKSPTWTYPIEEHGGIRQWLKPSVRLPTCQPRPSSDLPATFVGILKRHQLPPLRRWPKPFASS